MSYNHSYSQAMPRHTLKDTAHFLLGLTFSFGLKCIQNYSSLIAAHAHCEKYKTG